MVLSDPDLVATVFAPSNTAFKDFITSTNITIGDLLAVSDLASILQYHVAGRGSHGKNCMPQTVKCLPGMADSTNCEVSEEMLIRCFMQVADHDHRRRVEQVCQSLETAVLPM